MTDPADVPARPDRAGTGPRGRRRPGSGSPAETEAVPVTVLVDSSSATGERSRSEPGGEAAPAPQRPNRPGPELVVDDLLGPAPATVPADRTAPAPAPGLAVRPSRAQVRAARRLQARKVGRLVRHVDLWSLLKVALLFHTCLLLVGVVAGMVIWWVLQRSGVLTSVEGFIEQIFLLEQFRFDGRTVFRFGVLGGFLTVVALSLVTVLGGLLFNLISDLTGGIRVSVVELETARPAPPRRRRRP